MQQGYRYVLVASSGRKFDPDFRPELSPQEMLRLGVFGGKYMTDRKDDFPRSWFVRAKLSSKQPDARLNYFGVDASQPLFEWRRKGWIHPDRALMVPKLTVKRDPTILDAGPDAAFEARAIAAQIGWLETSIAATAVDALCRIEILLSQGFSEMSKSIHHQLRIFEVFEAGLLATWETPTELVCLPRPAVT
jgi:hypothetical protein